MLTARRTSTWPNTSPLCRPHSPASFFRPLLSKTVPLLSRSTDTWLLRDPRGATPRDNYLEFHVPTPEVPEHQIKYLFSTGRLDCASYATVMPTINPNPNYSRRTIETHASFLLPRLSPSFTLLDIGCGPGSITLGFAPLLPAGYVTGIDASPNAISSAQAALSSLPEITNTTFQVGSAFALPFADNTLDVVYSSQMFPHLAEPVRAFREIHRVLKPGGILATRAADAYAWYPDLSGLRAYDAALARLLRTNGVAWPCGREMGRWAREAGFDRAKMRLGVGGTVYTSREERGWWASVLGGGLEEGGGHRAKLVESGTSEADVGEIARDLQVWVECDDGWYAEYDCDNIYQK